MKNRKTFLMALILILYFFTIVQGLSTFSNEQDDKNNKNIVPLLSASNSVAMEWNLTWGGNGPDYGFGVAVDSLNNVYLAGYTRSFGAGSYDMVLVKYNYSGVHQWNRTWGGSNEDYGRRVAVDSSDNMYLAGSTRSFGAGSSDMVLVKFDSSGVQQWNRTWGGSDDDYGSGVAVDSSDNVYLAGGTRSFGAESYDMVLLKYDSSGVQQWYRIWDGGDADYCRGVAVDSSDNVYLAGETGSFGAGSYDMVLVKYDSSGVQQWYRIWGGIDYDFGRGVAVDSSDNVYLAGYTHSFGAGSSDMVLVKYDSSGLQQWNRTWGGSGHEEAHGVAVDSSDNVYLAGENNTYGAGHGDMALVKHDSSGVQQWNRIWGGSGPDYGYGVVVDSSDNVYLAGYTHSFGAGSSDMVLVKFGIEKREKEQAISGYDLSLFTCVIGVITAISLNKKYNK
ncbi:hypothetical protein LCGC14_1397870 [marine sediment metagenome]|uniref:Bulb-type lectin domain-containing protein n=1 Tax=marine sediment metagenome TaxID=412755 RepID=A0A0F9JY65_9ZZZZ